MKHCNKRWLLKNQAIPVTSEVARNINFVTVIRENLVGRYQLESVDKALFLGQGFMVIELYEESQKKQNKRV